MSAAMTLSLSWGEDKMVSNVNDSD